MNDSFQINKSTCCCFTGHRNRDLPFFGDREKQGMKCLTSNLQLEIAGGVDLISAEIVHNLITRKGVPVNLVCALPYRGQGTRELTSALDRYVYSMILQSCRKVVYVSQNRSRECYKLRNQFMVDNSSRLIGVYRHKIKGSGTLQTINMAKAAGLDLHIIELDKNPVFYLESDDDA